MPDGAGPGALVVPDRQREARPDDPVEDAGGNQEQRPTSGQDHRSSIAGRDGKVLGAPTGDRKPPPGRTETALKARQNAYPAPSANGKQDRVQPGNCARSPQYTDRLGSQPYRRRIGSPRVAGHRSDRNAGRRRHRAVHRSLPQGGNRNVGRCAASGSGGAAYLSARTGRPAGGGGRGHPVTGKADGRTREAFDRSGFQGTTGGHLPAVQDQTADQGADRSGGRAPTAGGQPVGRPQRVSRTGGCALRESGQRSGGHCRGATGSPIDPGRAVRRRCRPGGRAPRTSLDPGQTGLRGARRQGAGRRQVQRLLRLRRKADDAALAPGPGHVPW